MKIDNRTAADSSPTTWRPLAQDSSESGVSLLEFVIVIPILLMFTFAIASFSLAVREQVGMTESLRNSIRAVASIDLAGKERDIRCGLIRDAVIESLTSSGRHPDDFELKVEFVDLNARYDKVEGLCFSGSLPAIRVSLVRKDGDSFTDHLMNYVFRPSTSIVFALDTNDAIADSC